MMIFINKDISITVLIWFPYVLYRSTVIMVTKKIEACIFIEVIPKITLHPASPTMNFWDIASA